MLASALPAAWAAFLSPLCSAVEEQRSPTTLTGLFGSAKGFVLSVLSRQLAPQGISLLVVTPTDESAETLYRDTAFFHRLQGTSPDAVWLFPGWAVLPYQAAPPPVEVIGQRMRGLDRLHGATATARGTVVLITSAPAFLQRLLPRALLQEACVSLRPGVAIERTWLRTRLLRLGYTQVSVVESPGEFAIRGGIMDLFSTAYAEPARIEFLGDTVETLRLFDPATQTSSGRTSELRVLPARELIRSGHDEAAPLPPDAEWRGPACYATMETLLDHFPSPPVLIADEPLDLRKQADEFLAEAREAFAGLASSDSASSPPDDLFLPLDDLLEAGGARCLVTIEAIPRGVSCQDAVLSEVPASPGRARGHGKDGASWRTGGGWVQTAASEPIPMGGRAPVTRWAFDTQRPQAMGIGVKGRSFSDTVTHLETLRAKGPVVIVARSRGQVDRLRSLFLDHDLPAEPLGEKAVISLGAHTPYALVQGELSGGLLGLRGTWDGVTSPPCAIIVEDELFARGVRHKAPATSRSAAFLKSIEEVKVGEYVVHVLHGIGRYLGLRRLSIHNFDSDYLVIEYAGSDTVYVPLDRLHQIQRYGTPEGEGRAPKLNRLGGASWGRTKARVRKSIADMAKDLIAVHAAREARGRTPFSADSLLAHEFEAAFEFEATEDQARAIAEITRDLESDKPMDRLICGDVGYGKTEVAMRAVFKVLQDGKQAAVLVPTTLLAQQHGETFAERFAPFPVTVGVVSRLQPLPAQKATLKGVADGSVDIIIGTHRLLQKDVQFRNLGLVVVDEEQWFGVRHKERLKQLRAQVDILTLTATPIPRTLQMALSGLRDLSVIETPPADRLAIRTQVVRFGQGIIKEAIVRELARGGQVFFVHNRVQGIERMGTWLQELVPEARIVAAHGQMDPRLLDAVMLKFHKREADVLVSTTIIESGLDIPNANTILVNRADTFGLAQLYQLRGRVGRSDHQAFAYFLVDAEETLTGEAQKRLQAIQEFTALGSGFRIAASDLEIRGGGNLLGGEQSGHIDAVGFELFIRMLEEAVQELKGEPVREEFEPTLQLPVSAYIPEVYVGDAAPRLSLYKRLTAGTQVGELAQLHGELVDRYGIPPEPVERLFEVMEIRLLAKALRIRAIQVRPTAVAVRFDQPGLPAQASLQALLAPSRALVRVTAPTSLELLGLAPDWKTLFPEVKRLLQALAVYAKNSGRLW